MDPVGSRARALLSAASASFVLLLLASRLACSRAAKSFALPAGRLTTVELRVDSARRAVAAGADVVSAAVDADADAAGSGAFCPGSQPRQPVKTNAAVITAKCLTARVD